MFGTAAGSYSFAYFLREEGALLPWLEVVGSMGVLSRLPYLEGEGSLLQAPASFARLRRAFSVAALECRLSPRWTLT